MSVAIREVQPIQPDNRQTWPRMTKDKFLATLQMSAEDRELCGIDAEPCWCEGEFPNCTGWQLVHVSEQQ